MSTKICMAVHDTAENGRTAYTKEVLNSLLKTVDFERHSLFISDNDSCVETQDLYDWFENEFELKYRKMDNLTIHRNKKNIGTARAVNIGIKTRKPDEYIIKMDNDCVVKAEGWIEQMEEALIREPLIGILGLKRTDLMDRPGAPEAHYRTELLMLPHQPGQKWITCEQSREIMGTCTMYNPELLDKIGYLWQPGVYGFDDTLVSLRSSLAGFINVFLPQIEIDHIDDGKNEYCDWKRQKAGEDWDAYKEAANDYKSGMRPIFEDFY